MAFVIDASVAAAWLFADEVSAIADAAYHRLKTEDAIAPSLWWFEMRNLLLVNERRGRTDAAQTGRALALLGALPIRRLGETEDDQLLSLARRHGLTAYDAAYLELALRERAVLATLDKALARSAAAEGVGLVGVDA